MIRRQLQTFLSQRRATLLGVGPMSRNCVDAAIELANEHMVPIMLVASRRQIECAQMGGGYVENWTTEQFANYVRNHDLKGRVSLARDHGGPWQNPLEVEKGYGFRNAMESAKISFEADIRAGFQILHIDTSVDIHYSPSKEDMLFRVFELMEFCWSTARSLKRNILFEIGTEEQSGGAAILGDIDELLTHIIRFCNDNGIDKPLFIVAQTGTRVMEMRNVGTFDSPVRITHEMPTETYLPRLIDACNKHGIYMKQHNTDYLPDRALRWHPKLGIHAANVAPEFGTTESVSMVKILRENGLGHFAERFLCLAFESRCWEKWVLPGNQICDETKSFLAGHYVFATEQFIAIKNEAESALRKKSIDLNLYLKDNIKKNILRYLIGFRLLDGRYYAKVSQ